MPYGMDYVPKPWSTASKTPKTPWRDLPETFGDWNSVFWRFSRWSIKGVWWRIFEAMSDDPDFEYLIVDSTKGALAVTP
jgi:hypothetical protein